MSCSRNTLPPSGSTSSSDLKFALNQYQNPNTYTKICDLREEIPYKVLKFEQVYTPFGETAMLVLEGHAGEDFYLRVYLPKRYNEVLTERFVNSYNINSEELLYFVKKKASNGSKVSPLIFI